MKAVRLVEAGRQLEETSIPVPVARAGEVLVRVEAAGICHSDAHYRNGTAPPPSLPVTLGHEVSGTIVQIDDQVSTHRIGDRVCLHYLEVCGQCRFCISGHEQFCATARMIGKSRDGGFAEYIRIPAWNAAKIPDEVATETAAIMMCSTATSFHAIRQSRFQPGETAAVFGIGGLGLSAVQLLLTLGATEVFAVDISEERLAIAEGFGASPINAATTAPVEEIIEQTRGAGVDVALELLGSRITIEQSIASLAPRGRAAVAGISAEAVSVDTYRSLVGREAELIGVSDHLRSELDLLLDFAARERLTFDQIVTERVPLEAAAVNRVLDRLEMHGAGVRAVITPG